MRNIYFILMLLALLSITISPLGAQEELTVTVEKANENGDIGNGSITLKVKGGEPPYQYKWSKSSVSLDSNQATGLSEGQEYTIVVTDSAENKATVTASVPVQSRSEFLNSLFVPLAGAMEKVLFFDLFEAIGIYNPIVYDDQGKIVRHPNGDPRKQGIPFILVWLIAGAIFFTLRMSFINIRGMKHAIDLVRGKYDNPEDEGEISHFQALSTALSATVGLGNIAGVAIAINLGGPGAMFWLIIAGFLGMSTKFVECTLGVKYRMIDEHGVVSGGPMHYLSKGLALKNLPRLGKVLAFLFAAFCIIGSFGGGNMFQANQAFEQVSGKFPAIQSYGAAFGAFLAILVGFVIIGGVRSIARVADKIVPFMCSVYVLFAIIIIGMNFGRVDDALMKIINGAFYPDAIKGGLIGVLVIGFQRAAFSNEAGIGSAAIAHSATKTNEPVSEGMVALLEPFIDTIVVCTMTALVLIFTGYGEGGNPITGAQLTSAAFKSVFPWFEYVLTLAIFLFAFSTMISWSYYGLKSWEYIFGKHYLSQLIYKVIFLVFIVIGASSQLGAVLSFSDVVILAMAFPNVLGLIILSSIVAGDLKKYLNDVKTGAIKRHD